MKAFLIVSMILLVSGIAYSQDVSPTENDQLKVAMIEMAKIIADQKNQSIDQSKTEQARLVELQAELTKTARATKDANDMGLILSGIALPVGIFAGCAIKQDFALGSEIAVGVAASEAIGWGVCALYETFGRATTAVK